MNQVLLNTLYIATPGAFARLDGDTVKVESNGERLMQVPLLHLGSLVFFDRASPSAPLMQRCAQDGRAVIFLNYAGKFQCRVSGPMSGNVLLRKAQYDAHASPERTLSIARNVVAGKIRNSRNTLQRAARDAKTEASAKLLSDKAEQLATYLLTLPDLKSVDALRGIEGQSAGAYFGAFGAMILREPSEFSFATRSRRPPRDRTNALLSFLYALLTSDCVTACETVGLDPQFGFLHAIRPGRPALALDLVEEFRSYLGDRLALTLLNRKQLSPEHFDLRPGESAMLNDAGRKIVLTTYQTRKKEEVHHPLMDTKVPFGLLPHLQARLLARHLRGDTETYIPFLAK